MATPEELFQQWDGKLVPRSFNAGFVTLSYVVSFIGSASTLELINRRTAPKGTFNHLLLISAAITMGGIAIWCMHYIGNRAIDLADGETELQIAYSSGFTALSFFVPIAVLLAAFVAIGTNNKVSWWRVAVGGTLAGAAICGMHYLGNASISNYSCQYNIVNVVGSAIIAVAASITALSLFFIFRAAWTNSWWKRALSAIVLAGAVSGMHWCASTGTSYRLMSLNEGNNELSRNTTVIVVICLSIGACLIMAGTVFYSAQVMKRYAHKAQQVVLAAAVFDKDGRVLVSPEGLLPSEKITDTFMEKTAQDSLTIAHPLFHWMFRASRNWSSIENIIDGMSNHLSHLPRVGKDSSRGGVELINDHGELTDNYEVIFRELFCTAAQALASKLKSPLTQAGVLWDEILPTGSGGEIQNRQQETDFIVQGENGTKEVGRDSNDDLAEKGLSRSRVQEYGRGSLMFLVRRAESVRELEALEAAGYRFAEVHQVSGIIGTSMQIKTRNVEGKLRNMRQYAEEENSMLEPGVHMGFFGVRARVGTFGFDILARRTNRNMLPSIQMPLNCLEPSQISFLRQLDRLSPDKIVRRIEGMKQLSTEETFFASQLTESMDDLRSRIGDPVFDEALLTCKVVEVPCRQTLESNGPSTATMIVLRVVIPIHQNINSPQCEFVPLSFFKIQQLVYRDSPHHLVFARSVHRELAPIINAVPVEKSQQDAHSKRRRGSLRESRLPQSIRRLGRPGTPRTFSALEDGQLPGSSRSSSPRGSAKASSTKELWSGVRTSTELNMYSPSADSGFDAQTAGYLEGPVSPGISPPAQVSSFGGIMVSQEITINVHDAEEPASPSSQRPMPAQRASSHGKKSADTGAIVTTTIELKNIREGAMSLQPSIGVGMIVANAEVETESSTFVDELFAICVDQR